MDNLIVANVRQRPLRTAVSIAGVGLGVILVALTVGLANGMMNDSAQRQSNVDAELRMFPSGPPSLNANPLRMPTGYADAILRGVRPTPDNPDVTPKDPIPGVAAATPVGEWIQATVGGLGFELVDGIEYESFARTTPIRIVEGRALGDGKTPGSKFEVIIDRFHSEHSVGTDGRPVRVGSKVKALDREFTVVGIYEPSIMARVKMPLATLQELLGGADNCTFVLIKTERPELAEQVKAKINEVYPGNSVWLTRDLPALYSQSMRPVEVFLNVVISLAVVISTLVILLAMYTTIIERTREIGILKSLGASRPFIVWAIEKEALLISALGVVFGFLVSVIGKYLIEANTRLVIHLQPKWLLIAAGIGLLCGVIGALYPAMRAANLDPIEALSYE